MAKPFCCRVVCRPSCRQDITDCAARSAHIIPRHDHRGAADRRGDTNGWGAFMPLYALRSQQGMGSGDYGDLGAFSVGCTISVGAQ
jgi:hypothetical protein